MTAPKFTISGGAAVDAKVLLDGDPRTFVALPHLEPDKPQSMRIELDRP